MRKMKNLLNRIPRPLKACICWVLVIVLAAAYYIALGCPTLTLQQEMRRAEKIHLVGPSKIVDRLYEGQYEEFTTLLVGETEHGIVFFGRYYNSYPYDDPFAEKQHMLSYVEKTGDITVAAAPNIHGFSWEHFGFQRSLPVYIFTEDENAVRAQIDITITQSLVENSSKQRQLTFTGSADRTDDRFFRLMIEADTDARLEALFNISLASGGNPLHPVVSKTVDLITATVRLYDSNDQMIKEECFVLYTPLGDN